MKRLFPVNEALTVRHASVLKIIAADLGGPVDVVYIGNGASGLRCSTRTARSAKEPAANACLCSRYWQECQARAAVAALVASLAINPDSGTA